MSNELLISLGALIAALISALYSARSSHIAKRALSIAEEEFNSKQNELKLYLIEGIKYIASKDEYIFGFNLSITNQATAPNSIQRIELCIKFVRDDGTAGNIVLQHDSDLNYSIKGHEVTPFESSVKISEKSAIINWCLFCFDPQLSQCGRVDKYSLRVTDVTGKISEIDSYLIKEYQIV